MTDVALRELTAKQARFVQEYLIDLNATQAAIRCGYAPGSAQVQGARLLANAMVASAVADGKARLADRAETTQTDVVRELAKIGFADIRKLFTPGGHLLLPADLDDDIAAAVASIDVVVRRVPGGEDGEVEHVHKIKLHDKIGALTQIGRHLGMFTDKLELSGKISLEALVLESIKPKAIEGTARVVEPGDGEPE